MSYVVVIYKTIGVAKIFDWGGANHKLHAMTSSEIFERRTFPGAKIFRMEDQKPGLALDHVLAFNQDFAKERGLKPKVKKRKCL